MKKVLVASLALALLASFSMVASAAEPVSHNALSSMGLGGMQQMSDDEGLAVRGKGASAAVWGGSTALWHGQSSTNSYEAGSSWYGHPASATGGSLSFAGKIQASYGADPTGSALNLSVFGGFAGGGAFAFAH